MRIAVSGKGGSGKTTLAATLARLFARRGYCVSAIDGDPNPNLAEALGVAAEQAEHLRRVPREQVMDEQVDAEGRRTLRLKKPFEEVLREYGAYGPDGVGVLMMTGVLGAGKGCLCSQHAAVRSVMRDLPAEKREEVVVLDMEASLEHMTRGTARNVDALLVVTEPYYRSLESAGRLLPLARELGLSNVWVVANKVRDERDEAAIREYCARHAVQLIGILPFDLQVTEADNAGRAVLDHSPESAAVAAAGRLADSLSDRLGLAVSA